MGQKVQPVGFRTGIRLPWQSTWFAPKANYGEMLVEDQRIRNYVDAKFNRQPPFAAVSKVEVARTRNEVKITLYTARPGIVIGPRGAEVDKFKNELSELIDREVNVNVVEVKEPALDAKLVAEAISEQMKKRVSFRRAMKQQCEFAMQAGAKGVKIICSGRLGGAEMARTETQKEGSIPLHTIDANVDFATVHSRTTYGIIGIKVWIYKGKFGQEITPRPAARKPARSRRPSGARPAGRAAKGAGSGAGQAKKAQDKPAQPAQDKSDAEPKQPQQQEKTGQ